MPGSYPLGSPPTPRRSSAPLEVGDLGVLALRELLGPRPLVLRVGLALLEHTLTARVRIAGEIPGGLLQLATDLVRDAHALVVPGDSRVRRRPMPPRPSPRVPR